MRRDSSMQRAGSPTEPSEHIVRVPTIPPCTAWGWEGPQSEQDTWRPLCTRFLEHPVVPFLPSQCIPT